MLGGCVAEGSKEEPYAVQFYEHRLQAVDPDTAIQTQGGVSNTVTATPIVMERETREEYVPLPTLLKINNQRMYEQRTIPMFVPRPDELRITVKVRNNLAHVLRLAGTVVTLSVAGQTVDLDTEGYKQFLGGIILPRQEGTFTIRGSALSTLPQDAPIALAFYDLVTQTDAAGNPTERVNFEWFFAYSRVLVEQDDVITKETVWQ